MHFKDARADGETEQRLYSLNAWRETPFYSDRECAALEWTEAVTLVSETPRGGGGRGWRLMPPSDESRDLPNSADVSAGMPERRGTTLRPARRRRFFAHCFACVPSHVQVTSLRCPHAPSALNLPDGNGGVRTSISIHSSRW